MVVSDGGEALVAQQLLPDLAQAGLKLQLVADVRVGSDEDDGRQGSDGLTRRRETVTKLTIALVWPASLSPSSPHHQTRGPTKSCFLTHFDVEEPGFEGVHLAGSSAQVVHHQVEGPGGQEVGVRATEFLPACRGEKLQLDRVQRFSREVFIWSVLLI